MMSAGVADRVVLSSLRSGRWAPFALAIAACLAFPHPSRAQVIDPDFWTPNGSVTCMARLADTLYFGGTFDRVGPRTGSFVAIDRTSAEVDASWPRVEGDVRAIVSDGAGGLYIGGRFWKVAGIPRASLAHIRADGSLDPWDPGTNGNVNALALLDSNTLLVGGDFTTLAGQPRARLGSVNRTTGQLGGWDPGGFVAGETYCITVHGASVYVGGNFTALGGKSRRYLAELSAATGAVTPWNPDPDFYVKAVASRGGSVYLGGNFQHVGGDPRIGFAEVDSVTGIATDWNPTIGGSAFALSPTKLWVVGGGLYSVDLATRAVRTHQVLTTYVGVQSIALVDTTVYIGGGFAGIDGVARVRMAALGATGEAVLPWAPPVGGTVLALGGDGTHVFAGGAFEVAGGVARAGLAAIDLQTGRATAWNPIVGGLAHIYTLLASGSRVYAGGNFSVFGTLRKGLVALDERTGEILPWVPDVPDDYLAGSSVYALALRDTILYVGGYFRGGLIAVGTGSGARLPWAPGTSIVTGLSLRDSTVIAIGGFDSIGGRGRQYIAEVSLSTALATPWNPAPDAGAFAIQAVGETIYAGGTFLTIGGQARSYLAALDATSAQALPWTSNANNYVRAILWGGTTIYVGGDFSFVGGAERIGLAALDAATGAASSWDAGLLRNVSALATDGTWIYAGSPGTDWAGNTIGGLLRISAVPGSILKPQVTASEPAAGDTLLVGETATLAWSATAPPPGIQRVDFYLSRSGLAGPWDPIALGVTNTGHYAWPVTGPAAGDCRLRVEAHDFAGDVGSDTSAAFVIVVPAGPPQVTASEPATGDTLVIGDSATLAWSATASPPGIQDVSLYLSRSGPTGPWEPIALNIANSGQHAWSVASPAAADCRLRVDARDYAENVASDTSGAFTIVERTVIASFSASREGNDAVLRWRITGSQVPGDASAWRSPDPGQGPWSLIGASPRCDAESCSVSDPAPAAGRWWYRITIRDLSGNDLTSDAVAVDIPGVAPALSLSGMTPNPAHSGGTVSFTLPSEEPVRLSLLDLQGREVEVLADGMYVAGPHVLPFDGGGHRPGVYLLRMRVPGRDLTQRVVLLR